MTTRIFSIGLAWSLASCAVGAPIVVVGNHALRPNMANQTIAIGVTGADPIEGLNFRIQVEDGGPLPPAAGPPTGPVITSVDLITGTIFADNFSEQTDLLRLDQIWVQSVTTESGTVIADGLLATVTFDTSGFTQGSFRLALAETLDGPTDFAGIPITITDGMLHVVPEPSNWIMGLPVCLVMILLHRRPSAARRRARIDIPYPFTPCATFHGRNRLRGGTANRRKDVVGYLEPLPRPLVVHHKSATPLNLSRWYQIPTLGATEHVLYELFFTRFVPEGRLKIAQHLSAGLVVRVRSTSPGGTAETLRPLQTISKVLPSLRDSCTFCRWAPSTKVLGYYRMPLRGEDFLETRRACDHPSTTHPPPIAPARWRRCRCVVNNEPPSPPHAIADGGFGSLAARPWRQCRARGGRRAAK